MSGLSRDPEKAAAWVQRSRKPLKRSPMRRQGAKAKREQPALDQFRIQIHARSDGMCEGATPACPFGAHEGTDCHHVLPSDRDRGRHDPDRGLLLCRAGHQWTHANPAEARVRGLLLRDGDEL